ncbi:MAG TPA: transcriptional regulator [Phycisphaerales bacterium]|nr:transcriptional regulator [Phycisphaerales bacterium]
MDENNAHKLAGLFHRKWSVPVIAELARTEGSRLVVLSRALQTSAVSVRQTLEHLISLGLVMPNPGYGHPLRPEYILTPDGRAVAGGCLRILRSSRRLGLEDLIGRKWSMPVLWAVSGEPLRFGEIGMRIAPITDRALSQTLAHLEGAALVRRDLLETRPPASLYGVTRRARTLVSALDELAA